MRKLLNADLNRLWRNKTFWLTVILMACSEGVLCLLLLMQNPIPMDLLPFLSLQGIGILASVFFSPFAGTEYSDGTIRNKIIVGHKRSNIYLASLLTGILAVTIIYLAGILTGGILGILAFAAPVHRIGQIAVAGVIGWLACVSYISIYNLVGMLSSSKTRTSILCILIAFFLMFAGLTFYSLASQSILSGSGNAILQFLFEFNPFGQTIQAMSVDIPSPWRPAAYSLLLSFSLLGLGLSVFRKKDLK